MLTYKYFEREKYFKRLYFIPLIFLIWGNLHLGVITGIYFLFIFLLAEAIIFKYPFKFSKSETSIISKEHLKKLSLIFLVSTAVLLINPHGIRTYTYAYDHTKMKMLEQIAEWLSPFSEQVEATFVLTIYKVLLFAGLIVLFYSYKKRDLTFAFVYIAFAIYSIRAIRFTVDYEIVIIPLLAVCLNYYLLKQQNNKIMLNVSKFLSGNISKSLIIIILAYLSIQFQSDNFYISLKYNREAGVGNKQTRYFPLELYKFMKENNIKGTPFNNFDTGGYFKWEFPEQKIFIDSRNINDEIFSEYYSILRMQAGFQAKMDKYGIDQVIFFEPKLSRYPNILKQQITEYLLNNKNWSLVYWDDLSMLFVKNTPQNLDLISKFEYKVFNPYMAVFNQKQFEANILNSPANLEIEMKRKAVSEPQGYFYSGMNDIVRKVMNKKQ